MSRAISRSRSTSARRVSSSWRPAASRPSAPWFAIVIRWSRSSRESSSSDRLRPTARTPRSLPRVATGRTTPIPRPRCASTNRRDASSSPPSSSLGQADGRASLEKPREEAGSSGAAGRPSAARCGSANAPSSGAGGGGRGARAGGARPSAPSGARGSSRARAGRRRTGSCRGAPTGSPPGRGRRRGRRLSACAVGAGRREGRRRGRRRTRRPATRKTVDEENDETSAFPATTARA